jgi:DNA gyrase subunit B
MDGSHRSQRWRRILFHPIQNGGHITEHLKRIGDCPPDQARHHRNLLTGSEIFTETTVYNYETIKNHLRQMAFLNGGVKITLTDNRSRYPKPKPSFYNGGIKEYVSSSTRANFRSITM